MRVSAILAASGNRDGPGNTGRQPMDDGWLLRRSSWAICKPTIVGTAYWGMGRMLGEAIGKKTYGTDDPGSDKDAGFAPLDGKHRRQISGGKRPYDSDTCQGIPYLPIWSHRSAFLPVAGMWRRSARRRGRGVDTRIATDMISLAWDSNYDVAVLVSSDRDFVPVAEFLGKRGVIVIRGAFPPSASELSQACWGNLNIPDLRHAFQREQATPYSAP